MAKKVDTSGIDADFIISSFESNGGIAEAQTSPTKVVEEVCKKKPKKNIDDYQKLFIKEVDYVTRFGKQIFIRHEYHERIQKITQRIGKNEVSIFSYLDNVLSHHFNVFQDEITEAYDKNNPSIY